MARFGVDIFNDLVSLLKTTVFEGVSLWQIFVVGTLISLVGILWGFDLD